MDFLFENPLIIIIVLGIISSMFKKQKGEGNETQGEPKPFEESSPIPMPDIFKQFDFNREDKPVKQEISSEELLKPDYQAKAQAKIAELKERNREQAVERPQRVEAPKPVPQVVTPLELDTASMDRNKLQEAVVWAEILGPPRAKKPHRYRNIR